MKKIWIVTVFLLIAVLISPLSVLPKSNSSSDDNKVAVATPQTGIINLYNAPESFRILDTESGKISKIPAKEYIFGVVAGEMPALYEEEALKAQALCAYTFAVFRSNEAASRKYDLTTSHETDQCYITEENAREKWGENADEYVEKIKNAVKSVSGMLITYKGKPALTVYHAISSGKTEDVKNVWGGDYPYLASVSSTYDKLSPNYIESVTKTAEEVAAALADISGVSGEYSTWFSKPIYYDSGYVKSIDFCGKTVSGAKIRELFSLRSSCFEIAYTQDGFVFSTKGYGHGVGMSQNGANYMAKQGSDYKEIISHYFPDCKIEKN